MKGGITSGVVYPLAICRLAQTYKFKSVGGTSAGAIAAAATAAAEYGREKDGFVHLAGLSDELGSEGKLRSLFQPQRSTRRLFRVLIGALEHGTWGVVRAAIASNALTTLAGAAPGAALLLFSIFHWSDDGFDVLAALGCAGGALILCLGAVAAVSFRLARLAVRAVPDNKFGVCSGASAKATGPPGLTPWLADLVDRAAGLSGRGPLTFGHLWAGPDGNRADPPEEGERFVELQMMTTNLTNRTAQRLPWDEGGWYFDPAEFRELFPEEVVRWMEAHPRPLASGDSERRRSELHRAMMRPRLPLPAAADLPVVVATRLSLSFPILLSAVPLWRFDFGRVKNSKLETEWDHWLRSQAPGWRAPCGDPLAWPFAAMPNESLAPEPCWFSDGGISSNFPIHFFDRLVPGRPTFGINLRPFRFEEDPDPKDQTKNVWLAKTNKEEIKPWWYRLPERKKWVVIKDTRLPSFLMAAVRTMQNRVDEAQMRAPGFRDRIAHVKLSKNEGGMNLTMPAGLIGHLTERGLDAAELLHSAYTQPPDSPEKITWDNHRWIRLRSTLAVLEQMHGDFAEGYEGRGADIESGSSYEQLLTRPEGAPPKSYELSPAQRTRATGEVAAIRELGNEGEIGTLTTKAPRPTPVGRIVPRN